ncbi:MAG: sterol desaturase family protein [Bacteroidia bacterium]|nr:sterol desaturase family protein [Bacteroidia bacterium]
MEKKQPFEVNNKGSKTMFKNVVLEKLTRTHFLVPIVLYSVVSLYCMWVANNGSIDLVWWMQLLLYVAGILIFTLVEYAIHRFVFHFNAETEQQQKIQYNIHGVHHEYPRDKDRLVMPPVISVFLALFFYFLFFFLSGKFHLPLFAGFIEGYCVYLFIHYAIHRFRTPKNFLKILWKHHSLHHYGKCDTAFAVSFPFWDYVFNTMPVSQKTKES